MAEPTTTKVTLLGALAVFLGPLLAQYSMIFAGAVVGALAMLSWVDAAEFKSRGDAMLQGAVAIFAAALLTPAGVFGAEIAAQRMGVEIGGAFTDHLWAVVAFAIAAFGRRAVRKWAPWAAPKSKARR